MLIVLSPAQTRSLTLAVLSARAALARRGLAAVRLGRVLLRAALLRGPSLFAGGAQVGVEVEAEQLFDLRGDGRQHGVGEAAEFRDDLLALARPLLPAARRRALVGERARDPEADEDADRDRARAQHERVALELGAPVEHLADLGLHGLDAPPHLLVLVRDDRLDLRHGLADVLARVLHLPLKLGLVLSLARPRLVHRVRIPPARPKFSRRHITTQTRAAVTLNFAAGLRNVAARFTPPHGQIFRVRYRRKTASGIRS